MEQTWEFFVSMVAWADYFGAATFLRLLSGEALALLAQASDSRRGIARGYSH
jgi:hypothetical protein